MAFAPVCNVVEHLEPIRELLQAMDKGAMERLLIYSPDQNTGKLKCPAMLFTARDDENVPAMQVARFASQLKKDNSAVHFKSVARGGHYDSMIKEGIPEAIAWLKMIDQAEKK